MTSQLNVDTIVDKAGSGGSNVKMANTSTYVSEGGAVTQNTVQGLIKAWVNLNGTGTIATRVSNNVASITDNGTGDCTVTFTVAFGGNHYTFSGGLSSTSDRAILILDNGVNLDAASARLQTIYDGDTKIDCAVVTIQFAGDPRIMASQLKVDTLTGVTTAGSIVVTGEGNSTTTNLQQGLAKHWNQFVQSNASVADSFNQSSATDEGTGDTSWDFTNAMGNDDYSSQTTCNSGSYQFTSSYNDAQKTTAGDRCYSMTATSGIADATTVFVTTHGDLA